MCVFSWQWGKLAYKWEGEKRISFFLWLKPTKPHPWLHPQEEIILSLKIDLEKLISKNNHLGAVTVHIPISISISDA